MKDHKCQLAIGDQPVCSHALTPEMLNELGFFVERTDTIMGTKVVIETGLSFEDARHAAWEAGKSRLCTRRVM